MCACVNVCMCACIYVSMYLCIYVSMYLCIYVSVYLCIYVSMYLCIYVSMYLCIYVSMYLCTYVSRYLCMYVCMYVRTRGCLNSISALGFTRRWATSGYHKWVRGIVSTQFPHWVLHAFERPQGTISEAEGMSQLNFRIGSITLITPSSSF